MRPCLFRLALGFVLIGAGGSSARVAAEAGNRLSPQPRFQVGGDLGFIQHSETRSSLSVTSAQLRVSFGIAQSIGVGLDWGFLLVNQMPGIGDSLWLAGSGDPLLKLWYARVNTAGTDALYLSAGVAAPLAFLSYDIVRRALMRSAYAHAAATRGLWNVWLWGPEQISLAINAEWLHSFDEVFRLRLEAGAALSHSISQVTLAQADAFGQLAAAIEARQGPAGFGLRVQSVLMTSSNDAMQLSLSPHLLVFLSPALTLVASAVLNLDPPLGVFSTGLGMWGGLVTVRGGL